MRIQLVRHATLLVDMAGKRMLVDPMLSEAGAMEPVQNAANDFRIPMVDLPMDVSQVLDGVDGVLITHLHRDHFDAAAAEVLPKDLPVLCQPGDEERLAALGFRSVSPVHEALEFAGIEVVRTDGKHGVGLIGQKMGRVSGFMLRAQGEPSLYIAGDTIWCGYVREALETFKPEVVVVNAGAAQFRTGSPITMTADDVARTAQEAPWATVVAVHMETVNHCLLSRAGLRQALTGRGLMDQVRIPADGEAITFSAR
jgi:L-ascorbate metabolism protein UlaG (beta-lactamase superfamily)